MSIKNLFTDLFSTKKHIFESFIEPLKKVVTMDAEVCEHAHKIADIITDKEILEEQLDTLLTILDKTTEAINVCLSYKKKVIEEITKLKNKCRE